MEAASISQPSHGGQGSHAGVHDEHHHGPPEANRSQWIEKGLVDKLRESSGKPVQHVEAKEEEAAA